MSKQKMGMGNVSMRRSMGRGAYSTTKAADQKASGRNASGAGSSRRGSFSKGKATTKGE